jgi:hypothetical protein
MPKFPLPSNMRGGRIAQRLSAKTWQFPLISPELPHFYIYKKDKEAWKFLKRLSGSSPKYFLSHLTTFSQTQTGATVPLNRKLPNSPSEFSTGPGSIEELSTEKMVWILRCGELPKPLETVKTVWHTCSRWKDPEYSRGRLSKALGQLGFWVFGGGGLGEGWDRGGSVYKQPETEVDDSCHS